MKAEKVNKLPQQAKLTLVTVKSIDSSIQQSLIDTRNQLMARIAMRMLDKGK